MVYSNNLSSYMVDLIADTQGEIFEYARKNNCNMTKFITDYMNSDFCNLEMDSDCNFFHFKGAEVCFPYIEKEITIQKDNTIDDNFIDVVWIGKIYRYLSFAFGISSKELVKKIPPTTLDEMYFEYELDEIDDVIKDLQKNNL